MKDHHSTEDAKSYDYLYYVIGLVFGMITGAVLEKGLIWVPIGGVTGLLTAAFFLNMLVKGHEDI